MITGGTGHRRFRPTSFEPPETYEGTADAQDEHCNLLETARSHAERIIEEAEARATELLREAMTRGYADGMAEGRRIALQESEESLSRLATLVQRAVHDREEMVRSAEDELAALAVAIAEKIIRREVARDRTIVLEMVEAALEKVSSESAVRVFVHPEDAALVQEKWAELKGAVAFGSGWEVVGDDRMERGGCVIETRGGTVDSRIESQLGQVLDGFEAGL